ncbi:MAG: hypothetical protein WD876_00440 [Candidatus Pacearchaeota archaeon]
MKFDSGKKSTLESTAANFANYLSSDLNTITVYLNEAPASACVRMMDLEALSDIGFVGNNIFVKNSESSALNFDWNDAGMDLMAQSSNGNRFFKIYAADGIASQESSFSSCQDFLPSEYTVIIKKDRYVSEQKIISAFSLYKTNYNQLKQNIGITSEEFGFDFVYGNGTIVSSGNASNEQILNIFTKRINVDYFNKNLNFDTGRIIVKIW